MLKWLRKYNTWILVIGGSLLMIAFLLPQTIQEIGRGRLSGPVMKWGDGETINGDQYALAQREYGAIRDLFGRGTRLDLLQLIAGVENIDHWILLTHEAREAGLVGGPQDGRAMFDTMARDIARMAANQMRGADPSLFEQTFRQRFQEQMPAVLGQARLTEDQFYQALAQLRGVLRLRSTFAGSPRFSDRRLIVGAERLVKSATLEYIIVPGEREMGGITPPDEAALKAHFDAYKNTQPGVGAFGFGYLQPDRIKLTWLTLDRDAIRRAIVPDAVEVEKRFLRQYPTGSPPAGVDAAAERTKLQNQVVDEATTRVLRSADQAVRSEFEKALRRLEVDGEFKVLPSDWASQRPDLNKIAQVVVERVREQHQVSIPAPEVRSVDDRWVTRDTPEFLGALERAALQRGQRTETAMDVLFRVRELAGSNPFSLQVGVPLQDAFVDPLQNRHYVMVLDARKASPPDSIEDVRAIVLSDLTRLRAFERLSARIEEIRAKAKTEGGLEEMAKAPPASAGATGIGAMDLTVTRGTVSSTRFSPNPVLDSPAIRDALLAASRVIDPTKDPTSVPLADRVVVMPVERSLGILAARLTSISPLTEESLRTMERGVLRQLTQEELPRTDDDPFSYKAMQTRLNVRHLDGRGQEIKTPGQEQGEENSAG